MVKGKELKKEAAKNILKEKCCRTQDERNMVNNYDSGGRNFYYQIFLGPDDILSLIANCQSKEKVNDFVIKIQENGYNPDSYLFLRDLNEGEVGSFYVEDGNHRALALKQYLRITKQQSISIPAILVCKSSL